MNPKRPRRSRSTVPFGLVLLAVSGFGAGCGGSSGGGHGDADDFVGRWTLDPDSGDYTLAGCTNANSNGTGSIWTDLTFEYGELTDLTETSGACTTIAQVGTTFLILPGLPYDVSGDTATVPATDPYTGTASACVTTVSSDAAGNPIGLRPKPTPDWEFKLSPAAKGEPRRAELGVKMGGAPIMADLVTPGQSGLDVVDSCTLTGRATFFRFTTE